MAKRPRWTEADLLRLKALSGEGLSYDEIAEQLSRTSKAIEQAVTQHSLSSLRPNRRWNPKDRATTRAMMQRGASAKTIARHLNRSIEAVEAYIRKLRYYL